MYMEFGPVAATRGPAGPGARAVTGAVLRGFEDAHPDIALLHSVPVPGAGPDEVVDHVVAAGKHVWLVYSVAWPAGTYWAVQGPPP